MSVDILDRVKVRALQRDLNLTDTELARRAGMRPETFFRWRDGRAPDMSTVVRLYSALDVAGGTVR